MNIQYLLVLLFACTAGGMTYVLAGEPFRRRAPGCPSPPVRGCTPNRRSA